MDININRWWSQIGDCLHKWGVLVPWFMLVILEMLWRMCPSVCMC